VEIRRAFQHCAEEAWGVVVVIDVIRAFSVAAYTFGEGARELWLVREVEDARALREREPEALLAGEMRGGLIPGFDFNNSPSQMALADVRGRMLIQRTGAGTRGAVGAANATHVLPCALVNARATADYARKLALAGDGNVTLFPTCSQDDPGWPDEPTEDDVCADYVEALLLGRSDAMGMLERGLTRLRARGRFGIFAGDADFPAEDEPAVLAVDRFAFAMEGRREQAGGVEYVRVRRVDVGEYMHEDS
jgi:2-phosphosulfolactate phosphatase